MVKQLTRSFVAAAFLGAVHVLPATAQVTPLPHYMDFDNGRGQNWALFTNGGSNPDDFTWNITIHNPYSEPQVLTHTCNANSSGVADNWRVSPAFSFASGGKIDSVRSFLSALGAPGIAGPGDTIGIYLLKGSNDPALASSVTLLYNFWTSSLVKDVWVKTTNIVIPPTPGNSYIAFRYRTVNNCMNAFFDNLSISGNPTAIQPIYKEGTDFVIAPNPAGSKINISTQKNFERLTMYNATGRIVYAAVYHPSIDIGMLPAGMYVLELADGNGRKGIVQVVKK